MKNPFQLEIPRRSNICSAGKEPLQTGMDYYSILDEDEEGNWSRQDFCAACWEKFARNEALNNTLSHWKSKVPNKKASELPTDRSERAFVLLKEALARNAPEDREEAFVLALFLARNKKLALREEAKHSDGNIYNIYEALATEEMLAVPKLDLSTLQVEKVQQVIAQKFKL